MLRLVALGSAFALLVGCACGTSNAPPTTGPAPGSGSGLGTAAPPVEPPVEPTIDLAQLGADCGAGDRCTGGTTCVTFYGIAGPQGPAFKSCELPCADGQGGKGACPAGSSCVLIADGPGQVCRPDAAPSAAPAATAE